MSGLLGQLPGIVAGAAGDLIFTDATIVSPSGAYSRDGYATEPQARQIKAFVSDYSEFRRAQTGVPADQRKVMILGDGLLIAPTAGDIVTINDVRWALQDITSDPANAVYECAALPAPPAP